ncbi:hypothetical protein E4U55_001459, partial [Claviceps digitariae]
MLFRTAIGLLAAVAATAAAAVEADYYPYPFPHRHDEGWETRYTATGVEDVAKAAATALTSSPTSQVKGKAFDRFVIIYFENQNYDKAFDN